MFVRRLLSCAALLVFLGAPLLALSAQEEVQQGSTASFRWSSPKSLLSRTRPLTALVDQELAEVTTWLGLSSPPVGELLWVESRDDLSRELEFKAPKWYVAVTQPHRQRIIMVVDAAAGQEQLLQTLRHELAHWSMQSIGLKNWSQCPAWFHEGVANTWATSINRPVQTTSIAWTAFHDELPWLREYREAFGSGGYQASMGYALGEAFVRRLVRIYGDEILPQILQGMSRGESLDEALVRLTELSLIDHEMGLRLELGSWRALLAELAPQFFTIMTLVVLCLVPATMIRRRRRHEAEVKRWEEEERLALEPEDELGDDVDDRWLHKT